MADVLQLAQYEMPGFEADDIIATVARAVGGAGWDVRIVTGDREALTRVLAEHDGVDGLWYFGGADGSKRVEELAAANLKRTWVNHGRSRDWLSPTGGEGRRFLREACQVKNIWLPYGD